MFKRQIGTMIIIQLRMHIKLPCSLSIKKCIFYDKLLTISLLCYRPMPPRSFGDTHTRSQHTRSRHTRSRTRTRNALDFRRRGRIEPIVWSATSRTNPVRIFVDNWDTILEQSKLQERKAQSVVGSDWQTDDATLTLFSINHASTGEVESIFIRLFTCHTCRAWHMLTLRGPAQSKSHDKNPFLRRTEPKVEKKSYSNIYIIPWKCTPDAYFVILRRNEYVLAPNSHKIDL